MSVIGRAMGFMGNAHNFATWNSADKGSSATLSNGALTWSASSSTNSLVRATIGFLVGAGGRKVQWEIHPTAGVATIAGVSNASASLVTTFANDSNNWGMYSNDGTKVNGAFVAYGSAWSSNILTIALDAVNGTLKFAVDGVDKGTAFTGLTGTLYPSIGAASGSTQTANTNFGGIALTYPYAGYDQGAF